MIYRARAGFGSARAAGARAVARGCELIGCIMIATGAFAQPAFPVKPVRIIVPFPAGGGSDVMGRILAQRFTERWNQQVLVDNRPGAGGSIGTEIAVRASPDGYTLVLASTSEIAINPSLYGKLGYDPVRELSPIGSVATTPLVAVVSPAFAAKTVREIIDYARAKPKQLNVASAGNGTITHLSGELFRSTLGLEWVHVPYKGAPPALADLAGGQVQLMFSSLPAAVPLIKAGRIRALAVSSRIRASALPDVPTAIESGVPGYEVDYWYGLFAPLGVPAKVLAQVRDDLSAIQKNPDFAASLAAQGAIPGTQSVAEFTAFITSEAERWARTVKASGARAD
ncbi:MAG: tripartite tricarboxylate transporter substrate binding protein [Proteobacteria bacterium]|nr:tripartite tricarboxylate transporter substrate binding protein [Burkholderiales bacterium]